MSEAMLAPPPVLAPLSTLWNAMAPTRRPVAAPPVDVGAIAAAAEAQGFARGQAEAEAALAPALAALATAVAALDAALVIEPATLHPLFVDLVTRIASAVVGGELRHSGDAVERLVTEALGAVEGGGEAMLHMSGVDAAHFRHPREGGDPARFTENDSCAGVSCSGLGPRLRGDDGEDCPDLAPRLVIDPDLAPGEIRVETAAHVIAASLDARLAAIVAGL